MRLKMFIILALTSSILFFSAISYDAENTTEKFPVLFLPEGLYTFDPVLEGDVVTHDFIVQNKGTAPLEIKRVKTG